MAANSNRGSSSSTRRSSSGDSTSQTDMVSTCPPLPLGVIDPTLVRCHPFVRMHRITGMETRRLLPALAVLFAVVFAGACSQPPPQSLRADTASYHVQLDLDAASLGRRTATIQITDSHGDPVDADQVVVTPVMAKMGMTRPAVVADELGPGRYRATGELFSMLGKWTLTVRVESAGAHDEATFTVNTDTPDSGLG